MSRRAPWRSSGCWADGIRCMWPTVSSRSRSRPRANGFASTGWCFDGVPAGARALFTCIPTVNKAVVAATVGAAEAAQAVGEHLALLLRGYAPIHRAARRQGVPTIGVSHGTVFGCVSEHGVPMAGFDHEFTTGALFGAEAQAFMLGHIHRHQAWEQESRAGRQCIAYPGSIGRFHYGEEGDKGFLLWEVDADQARFTLEPTPARRTCRYRVRGQARPRRPARGRRAAGHRRRVRARALDRRR
jgi:DNA repair exonuclease SbcCD nuclease subunit